jgi:hypothetical protein
LYLSSQYYPEWCATVADITQRKRRYCGSSGRSPEFAPIRLIAT